MGGILCLTFKNLKSTTLYTCLTTPFDIDKPEFEKSIPDIYRMELQLNKANTSDKETSFLDLNINVKLFAVMLSPAFTTNAMSSDFLLSISTG